MTIRFQRLILLLLSLIFLAGVVILILFNSKNNLIYFFTPTELINSSPEIDKKVRIGGFVKSGSLKKDTINNIYSFIITDNQNDIKIEFKGILPDLFKENQGAVIEGNLVEWKKINASKVFAKHDENYMPASIKKQLEQSSYWQNDYSQKLLFDQQLPNFETTDLFDEINKLSNFDIDNKQVIINFFASWCAPCKEEHPLLFSLKKNQTNTIIIGINYKDAKSNALNFLEKEGNPYHFIGIDENGKIGLEFGVIGLPETFLTNNKGKIVFKHTGPLTSKIIQNEIIPRLQ